MHVGTEIELFRQNYGFAVSWFCKTLDMTEPQYRQFIIGRFRPSAYQLVFFLTAFRCHLESIEKKPLQKVILIARYHNKIADIRRLVFYCLRVRRNSSNDTTRFGSGTVPGRPSSGNSISLSAAALTLG